MKRISLFLLALSISCGKNSGDQGEPSNEPAAQSDNAVVATPNTDTNSSEPLPSIADSSPAIPPPPAPVVHEQTIDASSTMNTVYLKLDQGQLVTTTSDQPWLFAVKRTQFQTNSGTSGTRGVGVHNSASTDFAAISSCSNLSYTYDEMLPASGAPGSQPYSGNAVLNAWYDYDSTTHTVSSKQHVYALSDGNECLKLQILSYVSGVYSMKVSQL